MSDKPEPTPTLDPDEVDCPQCSALVGQVCRTPTGRKARNIHKPRRELAASIKRTERDEPVNPAEADSKPTRSKRRSPATPEGRRKGGKAAQEKKRRERAEIDALLVDAKARAILRRAEELAEDAVEWDIRRMTLRRLVLDTATHAWSTLAEAIENYARIQTDEQGHPTTTLRETDRGKVVETLDRRGTFGPDDVKALAVAAGIGLDKVRLEEGSATARNEHTFSGLPGEGFADTSDAELKAFVKRAAAAVDEADSGAP